MTFKNNHPPYPSNDHEALSKALGITPKDRVLDIGGGHQPFIGADVVVDIDFSSGHHRDGIQMPVGVSNHLYVQADITELPFPDKTFDVVLCIHVLEHSNDPAKACEELMRVAQRGFLETPRKWTEFYAGYPTHQWLIDDHEGFLAFEPINYIEPLFLNFALPPAWRSQELLKRATVIYPHIPCVQLAWEKRFDYRVMGESHSTDMGGGHDAFAARHYYFARNLLYWAARPRHGIYHAARAVELAPHIQAYANLYHVYLVLNGKWRQAIRRGLTPKLALIGGMSVLAYMLSKWTSHWFRRIIDMLGGERESPHL